MTTSSSSSGSSSSAASCLTSSSWIDSTSAPLAAAAGSGGTVASASSASLGSASSRSSAASSSSPSVGSSVSSMMSLISLSPPVDGAVGNPSVARGLYCRVAAMQRCAPENNGSATMHSPIARPFVRQAGRDTDEDPRDVWGRDAGAPRSLLRLLGPRCASAGAVTRCDGIAGAGPTVKPTRRQRVTNGPPGDSGGANTSRPSETVRIGVIAARSDASNGSAS